MTRATDILNRAAQAMWIEQQPKGNGPRTWEQLSFDERAYWGVRAYPAVASTLMSTRPGDHEMHEQLRGLYQSWKQHGLLNRVRDEHALLTSEREKWDGPQRAAFIAPKDTPIPETMNSDGAPVSITPTGVTRWRSMGSLDSDGLTS